MLGLRKNTTRLFPHRRYFSQRKTVTAVATAAAASKVRAITDLVGGWDGMEWGEVGVIAKMVGGGRESGACLEEGRGDRNQKRDATRCNMTQVRKRRAPF